MKQEVWNDNQLYSFVLSVGVAGMVGIIGAAYVYCKQKNEAGKNLDVQIDNLAIVSEKLYPESDNSTGEAGDKVGEIFAGQLHEIAGVLTAFSTPLLPFRVLLAAGLLNGPNVDFVCRLVLAANAILGDFQSLCNRNTTKFILYREYGRAWTIRDLPRYRLGIVAVNQEATEIQSQAQGRFVCLMNYLLTNVKSRRAASLLQQIFLKMIVDKKILETVNYTDSAIMYPGDGSSKLIQDEYHPDWKGNFKKDSSGNDTKEVAKYGIYHKNIKDRIPTIIDSLKKGHGFIYFNEFERQKNEGGKREKVEIADKMPAFEIVTGWIGNESKPDLAASVKMSNEKLVTLFRNYYGSLDEKSNEKLQEEGRDDSDKAVMSFFKSSVRLNYFIDIPVAFLNEKFVYIPGKDISPYYLSQEVNDLYKRHKNSNDIQKSLQHQSSFQWGIIVTLAVMYVLETITQVDRLWFKLMELMIALVIGFATTFGIHRYVNRPLENISDISPRPII